MRSFKFRSHKSSAPIHAWPQNEQEKKRWNANPHREVPHKISSLLVNLKIMWQYEALTTFIFQKEKSPLVSYATCQRKHSKRYTCWASQQDNFSNAFMFICSLNTMDKATNTKARTHCSRDHSYRLLFRSNNYLLAHSSWDILYLTQSKNNCSQIRKWHFRFLL